MSVGNVGGPGGGDIDFTAPITGPATPSTAQAAGKGKTKAEKIIGVIATNAQTVSTEVFSFFKGPKLTTDAKDDLADLTQGIDKFAGKPQQKKLGSA